MDEKDIPSLAKIHIAASHLRSISVPVTPILTNSTLNKLTGKNIYLKCETFQRTGSFKSRGALNIILNRMKIDPNIKGFVTYSSENHGIAVAYAAALVQRPCVVVISNDLSKHKIDSMKYYGAELIRADSSNPLEVCLEISKERDYFFIPTSEHPDIIAGHGTIAVELLEQIPDLDAIFVPVHHGGLISGIALYAKRINPNIRIYPCVSSESSQFLPACHSQHCGILTSPLICSFIEKQVLTVSDKMIIKATRFAFENLKLVVELASGLSLGAILSQNEKLDSNIRNIAIIITGGNIDLNEPLPWHGDQ